MKVLHLTNYYNPHIGGVETHVSEVVKEHIKSNHQISVITNQYKESLALKETIKNVEVVRIPKDSQDRKIAVWRWFFARKDFIASFDVIHVHDVFWWILPIYPLIQDKVYITYHGWETRFPIPITAKLQRLIYSKLAKGRIHIGDWIKEYYWDTPDLVNYGGALKQKKKELPFPKDKMHCVFVGRLSKDNAVPEFIELIKKLRKSKLDVEMTWVGDGDYRTECLRHGEVTGFVETVTEYLEKAHIVFANSYLAILEAQALGKIVCTLYNSELKQRYIETFPGTQYMLISETADQLVQKIKKIDQKKYRDFSAGAYTFASTQTWKKVAEIYTDLWKRTE